MTTRFIDTIIAALPKPFIFTICLAGILCTACGDSVPRLTVENSSWPDGTSLALIGADGIQSETTLYGSRAALPLTSEKPCVLRAASRDCVVFLSDTLYIGEIIGDTPPNPSFHLPPPVPRKKFGGCDLSLCIAYDGADSLYLRMIDGAGNAMSSVMPSLMDNPGLGRLVESAHGRGITVIARVDIDTGVPVSTIVGSAVVAGVDGVIVSPEDMGTGDEELLTSLRNLCSGMHGFGMTCLLRIVSGCSAGRDRPPDDLTALMSQVPRPERPDGVVLAFSCSDTAVPATAERIAEKLEGFENVQIPQSAVIVEIGMTAFKFAVDGGKGLDRKKLAQHDLNRLIESYGGRGALRLRDGSLRIGDKGALYVFGDCETAAQAVGSLVHGNDRRPGGFIVAYDGFGIQPEPDEFCIVADAILSDKQGQE